MFPNMRTLATLMWTTASLVRGAAGGSDSSALDYSTNNARDDIPHCSDKDLEEGMLRLTNKQRTDGGMKEVKPSRELRNIAKKQVKWMCDSKKLAYNMDKNQLKQNLSKTGYDSNSYGENIAEQEDDNFGELMRMWMMSSRHKMNITGDYAYTGIATCRDKEGDSRFWVQIFGNKDGQDGNKDHKPRKSRREPGKNVNPLNNHNDNKGPDPCSENDSNNVEGRIACLDQSISKIKKCMDNSECLMSASATSTTDTQMTDTATQTSSISESHPTSLTPLSPLMNSNSTPSNVIYVITTRTVFETMPSQTNTPHDSLTSTTPSNNFVPNITVSGTSTTGQHFASTTLCIGCVSTDTSSAAPNFPQEKCSTDSSNIMRTSPSLKRNDTGKDGGGNIDDYFDEIKRILLGIMKHDKPNNGGGTDPSKKAGGQPGGNGQPPGGSKPGNGPAPRKGMPSGGAGPNNGAGDSKSPIAEICKLLFKSGEMNGDVEQFHNAYPFCFAAQPTDTAGEKLIFACLLSQSCRAVPLWEQGNSKPSDTSSNQRNAKGGQDSRPKKMNIGEPISDKT